MRVSLKLDGRTAHGGTALIMHNERLADPLDEFTRAISAVAKKRGKQDADHLEIARLEFLGGLYVNANGPCLPSWNILRCLQDGAKRIKKGQDVLRGVKPVIESADVEYDGPRDPEEMWRAGQYPAGFALRKTVGVQRARTMRTRPAFLDWTAELPVEVDPECFDYDQLATAWANAGRFAGIGDMRPIFGRFIGTVQKVDAWDAPEEYRLDHALLTLAHATAAAAIRGADAGRAERHGLVSDLNERAATTAKNVRKRAGSVA